MGRASRPAADVLAGLGGGGRPTRSMIPLRIGVNALYLIPGGVGGTEVYLRSLLAALARTDSKNEYFVFTNTETEPGLVPREPNFTAVPQPVRAGNRPARIIFEQTRLPRAIARIRCDVVLNPGFTCPLISPAGNVTVFHDLQHKRHPEYFRWFDLPAWQFLLWAAAHRSRALIAVSEATHADLRRYYGMDATVIHSGVDAEVFALAGHREPRPFLLCLSTLHPHKNLIRLIRAYAALDRADYELVIAGMRGFHTRPIEAEIDRLGLETRVRLTGWVEREQILELLRTAAACIQPSTFEGFGLPVLEAMAAGVPLACSEIAPFREITGGCVPLFDPLDEAAIGGALRMLIESPPDPAAARAWSDHFRWEETARKTLAVLREAAGQAAGRKKS